MTNTTISAQYADANTDGMVVGPEYHAKVSSETISLAEVAARGGHVSRLRLLGERSIDGPLVDVSYVHATLADGAIVRVSVSTMPKVHLIRRDRVKSNLIAWAKAEGVYAKGLGLLDEANWSILW